VYRPRRQRELIGNGPGGGGPAGTRGPRWSGWRPRSIVGPLIGYERSIRGRRVHSRGVGRLGV